MKAAPKTGSVCFPERFSFFEMIFQNHVTIERKNPIYRVKAFMIK